MYVKVAVIMFILFSCSINARTNYSQNGIITYKKLCKHCCGNPYQSAAMLKKKE